MGGPGPAPSAKIARFFPGLICEPEAKGAGAALTCRLTLTLFGTRFIFALQGVGKNVPKSSCWWL